MSPRRDGSRLLFQIVLQREIHFKGPIGRRPALTSLNCSLLSLRETKADAPSDFRLPSNRRNSRDAQRGVDRAGN
jgi:hypothetical protein